MAKILHFKALLASFPPEWIKKRLQSQQTASFLTLTFTASLCCSLKGQRGAQTMITKTTSWHFKLYYFVVFFYKRKMCLLFKLDLALVNGLCTYVGRAVSARDCKGRGRTADTATKAGWHDTARSQRVMRKKRKRKVPSSRPDGTRPQHLSHCLEPSARSPN